VPTASTIPHPRSTRVRTPPGSAFSMTRRTRSRRDSCEGSPSPGRRTPLAMGRMIAHGGGTRVGAKSSGFLGGTSESKDLS
jgi:hypothetical protein